MQQCQGKTAKSVRCKRFVSGTYCYQHIPEKEEEWIRQGYPTPSSKIDEGHRRKIKSKLKRGPSQKDKEGYIYIYYLKTDKRVRYFKIGRTSTTVEKRLKQWEKESPSPPVLVESFKVKHSIFCERLIHLYLDYCRVYRYKVSKNRFCTVWKVSGECVTERDEKLKDRNRLEGMKKQTEWFAVKKKTALNLVKEIVELHSTK